MSSKKSYLNKKETIKLLEERLQQWKARYHRESVKLAQLDSKGLDNGDPEYNVQRRVVFIILNELGKAQNRVLKTKKSKKRRK